MAKTTSDNPSPVSPNLDPSPEVGYAWAITIDFLAEPGSRPGTNANAIGKYGPRMTTLKYSQIVNHPEGQRFRLYDDDLELCYEGVLVNGSGFEPQDDFGHPNAGTTITKIFNKETNDWEVL